MFIKVNLNIHIQGIHEGIRFVCDICAFQATHKGNLTKHIHVKHEGMGFCWDQCDYQVNIIENIQTKHKGLRY